MTGRLNIREISRDDWSEVSLRFSDLGFEQSASYNAPAADRIRASLEYWALEDDNGVIVAAAAVRIKCVPGLNRGIAWIASGPLLLSEHGVTLSTEDYAAVLATLRDEFATRRGHILRLRFPAIGFHDVEAVDQAALAAGYHLTEKAPAFRSVAIRLAQDDEALMKGFNGKWRTDLRYALKSDLTLTQGCDKDLQSRFLTMFDDIQERKGFRPDITPEFHFQIPSGDYHWEILIAQKDGADIAGIVVGWSGSVAVYLFGATAETGRRLRAGYFLTWMALRLSRERGLRWYDMGGIDEEANPSVARFKSRMNGVCLNAAGPYETSRPGFGSWLILTLENLRARLKRVR